ncbi:MAG: hypothetical protein QUV08_06275 [Parasphingorhabdus sp.]|nr:hypothetical protein [Parasphingorhabdus sp.]
MAGLGIGEIVNLAKDTLSPVGGTLSDVWQGVVGDRVASWRLKNAMATQQIIFDEAKKLGLEINTSKVPERYAFAWFEEATKQDEPEIQELFARLLLRASQGDDDALDRRHISILSQFTPSDAKAFESLFNSEWMGAQHGMMLQLPRWGHEATVVSLSQTHGQKVGKSVEHLINLGILVRGFQFKLSTNNRDLRGGQSIPKVKVENEIIPTGLGCSLHTALTDRPEMYDKS